MPVQDQELIRKAREGDNTAFGQLWGRYEARVLSLCRHYLDSPHRDPALDANDLAKETFIRALHNLERYEDRSQENRGFETWLLEIAKHLCLDLLARQRRRRQWLHEGQDARLAEHPDSRMLPARLVEEREILRLVAQEINALPDIHRLPFKLFLEEYSHREIAERLGISTENAMLRVHRARRSLQERLVGMEAFPLQTLEQVRRHSRRVEEQLTEIVSEACIVTVPLESGGELQICLRGERGSTRRDADIAARRKELQRHPRAWKQRLDFAELCYHLGQWEQAREGYRAVLALRPACAAASLGLGRMLRQEQRMTEAVEIYQAALQQSPSPEIAAQLQAESAATEGRDEEAVETFRAAIALAPQERSNYYGLHFALGRLSLYTEQLENLHSLRTLAPNDIFAYDEAYTPCARLQRWEIASPLLERAVEMDPNHPIALKHLFQVRMNLRLWNDQTLALAERLVRLAPDFVESWSELAWIYAEMGRTEESLGVLKRFLLDHPTNAEGHAALAWRYHYLHDHNTRAVHARRAYELDPQNWHVCWTLLVACIPGSPAISQAEALQFAGEIVARFPQDAFLLESLTVFYMLQDHEEEALAYAHQVCTLQPLALSANFLLLTVYAYFQHWEVVVEKYRRQPLLHASRSAEVHVVAGIAFAEIGDPEAEGFLTEAMAMAQTPQELLNLANRCVLLKQKELASSALNRFFSLPCTNPAMRTQAEKVWELLQK